MSAYDTTSLIAAVKRHALVPSAQQTFQTADFLAFLDEQLRINIIPMMLKAREDYFTRRVDTAILANQDVYIIPSRALGGALRMVQVVKAGGIGLVKIPQLNLQDIQNISSLLTGTPVGFYLDDVSIRLYPQPANTSGDNLRMVYFFAPGQLVQTSDVGVITAINGLAVTVTAPTTTTFPASGNFDIVQANPPFATIFWDQAATWSTPTATFTNTLPTSPAAPAIGDYVTLPRQSPVPQVPFELHPVLIQRTVCQLLAAIGDSEGLGQARGELSEMLTNAQALVTPRAFGNPKKAVNRNWF